jgi:ubiquinone/menaquinone biosynthesis C-methylase UbiE
VGLYADHILPRGIDWVMGKVEFAELRMRWLAGLSGDVVELGFGSGLNLPHYPETVTSIAAIEPSRVAHKLAAKRMAACSIPVKIVGLQGERVPLPDDCADAVLSTWTLCTIPDLDAALREIRRVLRPGGRLHFLEHGLSDDAKVARWQRRIEPFQKRFAGGCHLTRPMDTLLQAAGFELHGLERFLMKGPRFASTMFGGQAEPV